MEEVDRRMSLVTLTMERGDTVARGEAMAFVLDGSEAPTVAGLVLRAVTQTHRVRASSPGSPASALPPLATLLHQLQFWCSPLALGEFCFSTGHSPGLQRPATWLNLWELEDLRCVMSQIPISSQSSSPTQGLM